MRYGIKLSRLPNIMTPGNSQWYRYFVVTFETGRNAQYSTLNASKITSNRKRAISSESVESKFLKVLFENF